MRRIARTGGMMNMRVGIGLGVASVVSAVGVGVAVEAHRNRSTKIDDVVNRYMNRFDTAPTDDAISGAGEISKGAISWPGEISKGEFTVDTDHEHDNGASWWATNHRIEGLAFTPQAADGKLTREELTEIVKSFSADGSTLTRGEREKFVSSFGETRVSGTRGFTRRPYRFDKTPRMP